MDLLFLVETFLKPQKQDSVLKIPGYTLFRKDGDRDRIDPRKGRGILAYVKVDRIASYTKYF